MYSDNARRKEQMAEVGDYDEYLKSLKMAVTLGPFDKLGRSRIVQLINKSNQFNLTTRRYSEASIESFEKSSKYLTLQVRLTDAFGDNGMISVVICEFSGSECCIDTWLMSCRVLKRRVEDVVLKHIVESARARGALRLAGVYLPTPRNGLVKNHYEQLGFEFQSRESDGQESWSLDISEWRAGILPFAEVVVSEQNKVTDRIV
jgi:FkbH-like protein